MLQISILVVTYNSELRKLLLTLQAAVAQKGVNFEIVISDDGSPNGNHFSEVEDFFRKIGFTQYRLVANPANKGTVRNCVSAIEAATGEYIFSTSPGDVLFDEMTLSDFYYFCKKRDIKLCFGNAVHYVMPNGKPVLTQEYGILKSPSLYKYGRPLSFIRTPFMQGNFVVGAAIFQERTSTERWLKAAAETAVYMEDNTTTAYALAEKVPLIYYDRNFVWYEDGTGISTNGSDVWAQRIQDDWKRTVYRLHQLYPKDAYIDLAYMSLQLPDGKKRKLCKLIKHPFAVICGKLNNKLSATQKIRCTPEDLQRLEHIYREVTI